MTGLLGSTAASTKARSLKSMDRILRTLDFEGDDVLRRMQAASEGRMPVKPPRFMLKVYNKYSSLADGVHRTVKAFFDRGIIQLSRAAWFCFTRKRFYRL